MKSVKVAVRTADAAVNVSWIEQIRASKRRAQDEQAAKQIILRRKVTPARKKSALSSSVAPRPLPSRTSTPPPPSLPPPLPPRNTQPVLGNEQPRGRGDKVEVHDADGNKSTLVHKTQVADTPQWFREIQDEKIHEDTCQKKTQSASPGVEGWCANGAIAAVTPPAEVKSLPTGGSGPAATSDIPTANMPNVSHHVGPPGGNVTASAGKAEAPAAPATPSAASSVDPRFVPAFATFTVSTLTAVCRDDGLGGSRGDSPAIADADESKFSLGEIIFSGRGYGNGDLLGKVTGTTGRNCADDAAVGRTLRSSHAMVFSWTTLNNSSDVNGTNSTNEDASYASQLSARESAPSDIRASARLGEIRIHCRAPEAFMGAGAGTGHERTPTVPGVPPESQDDSSEVAHCLVLRKMTVTPVFALKRQQHELRERQQQRMKPKRNKHMNVRGSARHSPRRGHDARPGGRERSRTPPPLPPRPGAISARKIEARSPAKFICQVSEVRVDVGEIVGHIDTGLSGWLNLRGRWEAEDIAAASKRAEKLSLGET